MNTQQVKQYQYDYKNQAWVIDGKYVSCNHPDPGTPVPAIAPGAVFEGCSCYGKLHAGQAPDPELYEIGAIQ